MLLDRNTRAFTLIELLVVIAIIAVLASLAFPVFGTIQERARVTQDMNNLRQLGLGTQMYLNDNDGVFPSGAPNPWPQMLHTKYLTNWKVFQTSFDKSSPSDQDATAPVSYGMNNSAVGIATDKISNPSVFVVYAPSTTDGVTFGNHHGTDQVTLTAPNAAMKGTHNNGKRIDACMADWHVENMSVATFTDTTSDPSGKQRWTP